MKRIGFLVMVGSVFTLVSCATLVNRYLEPGRNTPQLRWELGTYTNEWGDKTGDYFTKYAGTVTASVSGSSLSSTETNIGQLTFSRAEGLKFRIPTAWAPLSATNVEIIVRSSDGSEENFQGRYLGASNGQNILIPFSENLLNALLKEKRIIRLSAGTSNIRYQFAFPDQFPEAWEVLQNRQNSASSQ